MYKINFNVFYLCPQDNLAVYYLIDDSPIVKRIFIDYNLNKSIKVDSTCYLLYGYFFFCCRKILITKYMLSYLNCLVLF